MIIKCFSFFFKEFLCPKAISYERFHDSYIFLDYGSKNEKLFHCGASSKDAGNKITTIMQVECTEIYHTLIDMLG